MAPKIRLAKVSSSRGQGFRGVASLLVVVFASIVCVQSKIVVDDIPVECRSSVYRCADLVLAISDSAAAIEKHEKLIDELDEVSDAQKRASIRKHIEEVERAQEQLASLFYDVATKETYPNPQEPGVSRCRFPDSDENEINKLKEAVSRLESITKIESPDTKIESSNPKIESSNPKIESSNPKTNMGHFKDHHRRHRGKLSFSGELISYSLGLGIGVGLVVAANNKRPAETNPFPTTSEVVDNKITPPFTTITDEPDSTLNPIWIIGFVIVVLVVLVILAYVFLRLRDNDSIQDEDKTAAGRVKDVETGKDGKSDGKRGQTTTPSTVLSGKTSPVKSVKDSNRGRS